MQRRGTPAKEKRAYPDLSTESVARQDRTVSYNGIYGYDGSRPQIDGLIKIVKDNRLSYPS